MAQNEELLELMREAWFADMYCGIESASLDTLTSISKRQNTRTPLLESIRTMNKYGIELSAGIIFGFDNDGPDTGERAVAFVRESGIPLVVLNVLHALPRTPLWRRLEKEGRLIPNADAEESNVVFKTWTTCTRAIAIRRKTRGPTGRSCRSRATRSRVRRCGWDCERWAAWRGSWERARTIGESSGMSRGR